jgi:hypothetical protein
MFQGFGRSYTNKIFIDSRFKTPESQSDSDFTIELPENVELNDYTGGIVTDITLPHTWYNVSSNNNRLFFRRVVSGEPADFMVELIPQNYDIFELAAALEDRLNTAVGSQAFAATSDVQAGCLVIQVLPATWTVDIFSDGELITRVNGTWRGPLYDVSNVKSLNSMLRINNRTNDPITSAAAFRTGFVDLQPLHSIYITSTKISNYSNLGPNGQRNVLKKMVVNSNFGEVNTYDYAFQEDAVNLSGLSLKLLDFQLRDYNGNVIQLNGAHVSFSLLFVKL